MDTDNMGSHILLRSHRLSAVHMMDLKMRDTGGSQANDLSMA